MEQTAKSLRNARKGDPVQPEGMPPPRFNMPVDVRSMALSVLAALAIIFTLRMAREVFLPVVISILFSYALNPVVNWLAAWKVPRWLSSAFLLTGLVVLLGLSFYSLADQTSAILEKLPDAAQKVRTLIHMQNLNGNGAIQKVRKAATELEKAANEATGDRRSPPQPVPVTPKEAMFDLKALLWTGSMGVMAFTVEFVMMVFLVFFLLSSGNLFKRKLVKIAGPSLESKKVTLHILDEIDSQIERFLLLQLFISTLVGIASWVALRWIGLEQAGMWGIASALFTWIPYFGPAVITATIALIGFLQFGSLAMAGLIAVVLLGIRTIEGMLLVPWLTGRVSNMNAVAVFIALLFWGWIWGVWGLLLAAPVMMVIKVVCDHVEGLRTLAEMLGE